MNSASQPLYFCLRVDEFAAQVLLRLRPAEHKLPLAVLDGTPPLEKVCAANAVARRMGVEQGLSRAELDSFPRLRILRRSLAEERNGCAVLLEMAGNFSPRFQNLSHGLSGAEKDTTAGQETPALLLAMDMTGTERVFGTPEAAACKVREAARKLGFHVRVAGSANLHAAACMVRAGRRTVTLLDPGREAASLAPLPVSALAPDRATADTLALWGITFAGELANLPETALVARLGQPGLRLRQLARGEHPHLLVPEEAAFVLAEQMEFDSPVDNLESLLFVLGPMLRQLVLRATYRALALASVTVTLGLEGAPEHVRTVKPALPLLDQALLLKLLQLDLQAHPPGAGILTVRLTAEPGPRADVQTGLFSPQLPEPARLEVTLARIAALVGEDRVGRVELVDSHAPEAFRMERFIVGEAGSPHKRSSRPRPHTEGEPRSRTGIALRRLRPPTSVRVQRNGTSPTAFELQGRRYTVRRAFGPWRRSGQWWTPEVWSREEWDVEAETEPARHPLLCLLAHDLLRQTWHMEALYD